MMEKKMLDELNNQINEEIFSSYLYLSMAAYFENSNFPGFATWMEVQAQEEMVHAMKFYGYVIERGGKIDLKAIEKPQSEWESPVHAFKAALEHEKHITSRINYLYKTAREVIDPATEIFLNWFVTEQVEEEANASEIVAKMEMIKDAPSAMYMLDKELGARIPLYTMPVAQ
ncbi:MAG: ferritin [Deltaproteobacteria bacterium]|nr:ferritin [Deltaproteobacteria bacterium]